MGGIPPSSLRPRGVSFRPPFLGGDQRVLVQSQVSAVVRHGDLRPRRDNPGGRTGDQLDRQMNAIDLRFPRRCGRCARFPR